MRSDMLKDTDGQDITRYQAGLALAEDRKRLAKLGFQIHIIDEMTIENTREL